MAGTSVVPVPSQKCSSLRCDRFLGAQLRLHHHGTSVPMPRQDLALSQLHGVVLKESPHVNDTQLSHGWLVSEWRPRSTMCAPLRGWRCRGSHCGPALGVFTQNFASEQVCHQRGEHAANAKVSVRSCTASGREAGTQLSEQKPRVSLLSVLGQG